MNQPKINFAIIGCGRIGERHAAHIYNFAKLVAVCDVDESRANAISTQYNIPFYLEVQMLITAHPEIDVVVVCTPNGLHAEHSIAALNAGLHVLCEKPMCIAVADGKAMIAAAEANQRLLFIVKQNRFNPPVIAVKNALDAGRLGTVFSIQLNCFWNREASYYLNSWKGTKNLDGGTLFTQFSHFIDLVYWMFGDVADISAITANAHHVGIIDFEDSGVVILRFANGILGTLNFTVNAYEKNMEGSLTIFGEKGTVKIGGQYLNTLEYQNIHDFEITGLQHGNPPNDYGAYQGSMSNHDKVYEHVIGVLSGEKVQSPTAFEGLQTVAIIERIYSAAKKHNKT